MFLNETKPPLEEALVHFGVRGMRWGVRRSQSSGGHDRSDYEDLDYHDEERHNATKRKIAVGLLVGAGAIATVAVLHKSGHLKIATDQIKNFRDQAPPGRIKTPRTFRPENVGNPLFTVGPKTPKATRDFVDAGFGKNGVFNVTTMKRGASTVQDFGPDIWDVPMLAITSGRRR